MKKYTVTKKEENGIIVVGENKKELNIKFVTTQEFGIGGGDIKEGDIFEIDEDESFGGIVSMKKIISKEEVGEEKKIIPASTNTRKYVATVCWGGTTKTGELGLNYYNQKGEQVWIPEDEIKMRDLRALRKGNTIEIEEKELQGGRWSRIGVKIMDGETKTEVEVIPPTSRQNKISPFKQKKEEWNPIQGEIYQRMGIEIPDSALATRLANERSITTKTTSHIETFPPQPDILKNFIPFPDYHVVITATSFSANGLWSNDASCDGTASFEFFSRLIDKLAKEEEKQKRVVPLTEYLSYVNPIELLKEYRDIQEFLFRTVETKAQRKAQLKTMNEEAREKQEIEAENRERAQVKKMITEREKQ